MEPFSEGTMGKIDFRLYLVTDRKQVKRGSLIESLRLALEGGVKAVQLREKDLTGRKLLELAGEVRRLTRLFDAKLFINDRVDVALAVEADGVHLGEKSIPVEAVRSLSRRLLVGRSTHSLEGAKEAEKNGADFITFGPVFETPSKIGYGAPQGLGKLEEITRAVDIPVFAIGGITPDRAKKVVEAGAYGVALISGILASDDPKRAAATYNNITEEGAR